MRSWLAAALAIWSIAAGAQEVMTTPNLINPNSWTGQSVTGNFGGSNLRDHVFGCCTGGPGAAVDTTGTGYIWFSWGQSTVSQTIDIASAFPGPGIKVTGFNYSYDYYNYDYNRGTLTTYISVTDNAGKELQGYFWNHAPTELNAWHTNSGTKTFNSPYSLSGLGSLSIMFAGHDDRVWAGYYGPSVSNVNLSLNYAPDSCSTNPLSSPTCPGFASALAALSPAPVASPIPESTAVAVTAEPAAVSPAAITTSSTASANATEAPAERTPVMISPRLLSIVRSVNEAVATTVTATVAQSIEQSQSAAATQDLTLTETASAAGRALGTGISSMTPESDAGAGAMTRPGDPVAAARSGRTVIAQEDVQEEKQQARPAPPPPAELAGGVSMVALAQGADLTAYTQARLRDAQFYAPREIYRGQAVVDNRSVLRGLGTDALHDRMVEQQYRK